MVAKGGGLRETWQQRIQYTKLLERYVTETLNLTRRKFQCISWSLKFGLKS